MAKKKQNQQTVSPEKYIKTKGRLLPVHECLIRKNWQKTGLTEVTVARKHTSGNITFGVFLVDIFCLGVKNSIYRFNYSSYEYEDFKRNLFNAGDFDSISYEEAHNIIYGAIAYAADIGIKPDKSFAVAQYLLEEDLEDIPLIEYEYGKDGKPFLITHTQTEANHYLPILRKNVGEGNFEFLIGVNEVEEEEDAPSSFSDQDLQTMTDNLQTMMGKMEAAKKLTHTVYGYKHPAYPVELNLIHEELIVFTLPENYLKLSEKMIDTILILPRETLLEDLNNMILFEIGKTYKEIPDELWDIETSTLMHVLLFLGELRAEESLPAILEIMRQNEGFAEYHFGDFGNDILPFSIYYTGRNQLPALLDFMKEPGLYPFLRIYVSVAVMMVALHEPERRDEVIEWYRDLLRFYIVNSENQDVYDATLVGMIMSDLLDMKAKDLLPEIKQLFETGQVDEMCSGNYQDVSKEIVSRQKPLHDYPLNTIYECYRHISLITQKT